MSGRLPVHGHPENQVFGLVGQFLPSDTGRVYIKHRDDTKNIGWDDVVPETPTPTPSPSITPTITPTVSITATPSPTPSATPPISSTPTPTPSVTPTNTPGLTPTASPTATPSATPTATPTSTPPNSPTPTPSVTPTSTPIAASPTPTPTSTPSPTPPASVTPTPTPTPSPVVFSYTSAEYNAWVYSPGWLSGARYTNKYSAGFIMSGTAGATTVQIIAQDTVGGGNFTQAMNIVVNKNGSPIRSVSSVTAPQTFNLTSAEVDDGSSFNVIISYAGSPNSAIRAQVLTSITGGPGKFVDASLNVAGQADPYSYGANDGFITLSGVPSGCTIPYLSIADNTMGGYMTSNTQYYSRHWSLDGDTVTSPAYKTNAFHSSGDVTVQFFMDTGNYQGASWVELAASQYAPINPSTPSYFINVYASGDGFVTGGGTVAAGTLTPVEAFDNTEFFNSWSSYGNGVNNFTGITDSSMASTTVFVDGPKDIVANFYP